MFAVSVVQAAVRVDCEELEMLVDQIVAVMTQLLCRTYRRSFCSVHVCRMNREQSARDISSDVLLVTSCWRRDRRSYYTARFACVLFRVFLECPSRSLCIVAFWMCVAMIEACCRVRLPSWVLGLRSRLSRQSSVTS